jgi:hypothetical protein
MRVIWGIVAGLLAGSVGRTAADEPAKKFLDRLRENDYHDVALEYLDEMETSPLASADFKARIKFEKAETLLLAAVATRDISRIERHLDQADQQLKEFSQANTDPALTAEAERVRARTLFNRGNLAKIQAQVDKLTVRERADLHARAREFFNEALAVFEKSLDVQRARLKEIRVDPSDPASLERRESLRREFVETRFMSPAIREQIADTLADGDPQRQKLLAQAAAEFSKIATDYSGYGRGLLASIAAGRCNQKLGKYEQALAPLIEILAAEKIARPFKLEAAILAIECWEKSQPPAHQEICGRIGALKDILELRDVRDPKVAAVQLGYAKACHQYAAELDASPNRTSLSGEIADLRRNAAKFAGNVARGNNPLRDTAKQVIAQWNLKSSEATPAASPPHQPTTFEEAKALAIDQLDKVEELRQQVQALRAEEDASESDAVKDRLEQTRGELSAAARQALATLHAALGFVTAETTREEINNVRARQAIAHFVLDEFVEAAVLGEYLLNRYASVAGTRDAANVAMRANLQLYLAAPKDNREFERTQLEAVCQRIVQLWPDEPGTDEAANVLVTLALQNNDLDSARKLMDTMEQGSAARARLESHLGRLAWSTYLSQSDQPNADPAAQQALLDEAERRLTSATAALKPETLTLESAFGVLNLIQILLEKGETDQALQVLESNPVAPLDILKQQLPLASDPKFAHETYRTALRVYVTAMRGDQQSSEWINKARAIVVALRETTKGGDAAQGDVLIKLYYQLARELIGQFDRIERSEDQAAFADSLMTFMQSIQEQSTDAKVLLWVGTTLNSLADKLAAANLPRNAKKFREQALAAVNRVADGEVPSDDSGADLRGEIKRQQALALRGQGEFDRALALFGELLKATPNRLNLQTDAAKTLQMQGDALNDPNPFALAVGGAQRDASTARPGNVIWGWLQIAKATQGKQNFANEYFEAVYNMSYCRLRYGELLKQDMSKQAALTDILNQCRLFPEMGGPEWKPKFEALAKQIQSSLGQAAVGLK